MLAYEQLDTQKQKTHWTESTLKLNWQWIQGVLDLNTIFRNAFDNDRKQFGTKLLHRNMHVVNLNIFQKKKSNLKNMVSKTFGK